MLREWKQTAASGRQRVIAGEQASKRASANPVIGD
jgi:hypothetical protein